MSVCASVEQIICAETDGLAPAAWPASEVVVAFPAEVEADEPQPAMARPNTTMATSGSLRTTPR